MVSLISGAAAPLQALPPIDSAAPPPSKPLLMLSPAGMQEMQEMYLKRFELCAKAHPGAEKYKNLNFPVTDKPISYCLHDLWAHLEKEFKERKAEYSHPLLSGRGATHLLLKHHAHELGVPCEEQDVSYHDIDIACDVSSRIEGDLPKIICKFVRDQMILQHPETNKYIDPKVREEHQSDYFVYLQQAFFEQHRRKDGTWKSSTYQLSSGDLQMFPIDGTEARSHVFKQDSIKISFWTGAVTAKEENALVALAEARAKCSSPDEIGKFHIRILHAQNHGIDVDFEDIKFALGKLPLIATFNQQLERYLRAHHSSPFGYMVDIINWIQLPLNPQYVSAAVNVLRMFLKKEHPLWDFISKNPHEAKACMDLLLGLWLYQWAAGNQSISAYTYSKKWVRRFHLCFSHEGRKYFIKLYDSPWNIFTRCLKAPHAHLLQDIPFIDPAILPNLTKTVLKLKSQRTSPLKAVTHDFHLDYLAFCAEARREMDPEDAHKLDLQIAYDHLQHRVSKEVSTPFIDAIKNVLVQMQKKDGNPLQALQAINAICAEHSEHIVTNYLTCLFPFWQKYGNLLSSYEYMARLAKQRPLESDEEEYVGKLQAKIEMLPYVDPDLKHVIISPLYSKSQRQWALNIFAKHLNDLKNPEELAEFALAIQTRLTELKPLLRLGVKLLKNKQLSVRLINALIDRFPDEASHAEICKLIVFAMGQDYATYSPLFARTKQGETDRHRSLLELTKKYAPQGEKQALQQQSDVAAVDYIYHRATQNPEEAWDLLFARNCQSHEMITLAAFLLKTFPITEQNLHKAVQYASQSESLRQELIRAYVSKGLIKHTLQLGKIPPDCHDDYVRQCIQQDLPIPGDVSINMHHLPPLIKKKRLDAYDLVMKHPLPSLLHLFNLLQTVPHRAKGVALIKRMADERLTERMPRNKIQRLVNILVDLQKPVETGADLWFALCPKDAERQVAFLDALANTGNPYLVEFMIRMSINGATSRRFPDIYAKGLQKLPDKRKCLQLLFDDDLDQAPVEHLTFLFKELSRSHDIQLLYAIPEIMHRVRKLKLYHYLYPYLENLLKQPKADLSCILNKLDQEIEFMEEADKESAEGIALEIGLRSGNPIYLRKALDFLITSHYPLRDILEVLAAFSPHDFPYEKAIQWMQRIVEKAKQEKFKSDDERFCRNLEKVCRQCIHKNNKHFLLVSEMIDLHLTEKKAYEVKKNISIPDEIQRSVMRDALHHLQQNEAFLNPFRYRNQLFQLIQFLAYVRTNPQERNYWMLQIPKVLHDAFSRGIYKDHIDDFAKTTSKIIDEIFLEVLLHPEQCLVLPDLLLQLFKDLWEIAKWSDEDFTTIVKHTKSIFIKASVWPFALAKYKFLKATAAKEQQIEKSIMEYLDKKFGSPLTLEEMSEAIQFAILYFNVYCKGNIEKTIDAPSMQAFTFVVTTTLERCHQTIFCDYKGDQLKFMGIAVMQNSIRHVSAHGDHHLSESILKFQADEYKQNRLVL